MYETADHSNWKVRKNRRTMNRVTHTLRYQPKKNSNLDSVAATTAIVGLLGGIFFLSSNVTGNAISNLSNTTSSRIGGFLFCVGLVSCFFWVKARKK